MEEQSRALVARGKGTITGATLPSISNYLKNDPEAPVAFLREAAVVLHVRPEWLMAGSGQPTEALAQAARVSERAAIFTEAHRVRNAVLTALSLPVPAPRRTVHGVRGAEVPPWVAPVGVLVERFMTADMVPGRVSVVSATLERDVGRAIAAPLRALGVSATTLRDAGTLSDYILTIAPALLVLAAERRRATIAALTPRDEDATPRRQKPKRTPKAHSQRSPRRK